jgi:hypothetical protein
MPAAAKPLTEADTSTRAVAVAEPSANITYVSAGAGDDVPPAISKDGTSGDVPLVVNKNEPAAAGTNSVDVSATRPYIGAAGSYVPPGSGVDVPPSKNIDVPAVHSKTSTEPLAVLLDLKDTTSGSVAARPKAQAEVRVTNMATSAVHAGGAQHADDSQNVWSNVVAQARSQGFMKRNRGLLSLGVVLLFSSLLLWAVYRQIYPAAEHRVSFDPAAMDSLHPRNPKARKNTEKLRSEGQVFKMDDCEPPTDMSRANTDMSRENSRPSEHERRDSRSLSEWWLVAPQTAGDGQASAAQIAEMPQ